MVLECQESNSDIDLAIVLDCTGSMAAHVNAAKNSIYSLFEGLREKRKSNVKIGVITYTDHDVGYPGRFNILPFTTGTDPVKNHIGRWCT